MLNELQNINNWLLILAALIIVILAIVLIVLLLKAKKDKHQYKKIEEYLSTVIDYQNQDYEYFDKNYSSLSNNIAILTNQLINIKQDNYNFKNDQTDLLNRQYSITEDNLKQINDGLSNQQNLIEQKLYNTEQRIEGIKTAVVDNLNEIRRDNTEKLEKIRETVEEKLNDTLNKRLSESFSMISERLETVYKSLGEMQSLSTGVDDLRKMLSNVKSRGTWGELQLGMMLEQVLNKNQYECNVSVVPNSAEKVEFALCLPNKGEKVYLPIDSKFPQESYGRLIDAYNSNDEKAINNEIKALNNSIKTEAKRISSKYIKPPHTTDFAIMYLPIEGLYAEVVKQIELMDVLHNQYRIIVAGPTTLLALLNSLQIGFKSIAIEQHSNEIMRLLVVIKNDFNNFSKLLELTQQRLHQASETIDSAFSKTKKIQRHLENVESIEEYNS